MPLSFERIGRTWTGIVFDTMPDNDMRFTSTSSFRCFLVRQVTEIKEILRQAGASISSLRKAETPSEAHGSSLIIAVLVTTATFHVGLSPPGGTCQDSYFPNPNNGTSGGEAHIAGTSIMGTNSEVTFALFMVFNSMDFSMSLSMINILTSKFPLQFELQICLVALFFTYNTAMTCIAPSSIRDITIIMKSVLSSIILTLTSAEKYCLGNYPQSSAWPAPSTHLSTLQTRAELVENLKTT
ncbi:hypothetical protein PVK06_022564 [Gossypium arboreum]|uniref:PGG domain-containing protein n=1 Tax=Gossypium arboreum TaxID=29729 RepID=A0ABR0P8T5_GOSAR|nr:hypothetical protein PVK06_022564 [Gossypium arboreum]